MSILKNNNVSDDDRIKLLKTVIDIFNKYKIDYWLEFGTLLGCYRDKSFIKYDGDIDIGTYKYNLIKEHESYFNKKGLTTEKLYEWTNDATSIFRILSDKTHVDIYEFEKTENETIAKHNRYKTLLSKLFRHLYLRTNVLLFSKIAFYFSHKRKFYYPNVETKLVKFYDMNVKIPINTEYHLKLMYGKTWITPRTDDISGKENLLFSRGKYSFYKMMK